MRHLKVRHGMFAGLLLAAAVVQIAVADNILYTGSGVLESNSSFTTGVEFTPAVDITVNAIGVFDGGYDGAGLEVARPVGIYNNSGTLLTSPGLTVDNSGFLENGFRFKTISPLVLSAGQTYVLAAFYEAGKPGDKLAALSGVNGYPNADVPNIWLSVGGTSLAFPTLTTGSFRIAANILFTPNSGPTGDGDINFDGTVDGADISLARRIALGQLTPTSAQKIAADIAPYSGGTPHPDNVVDMQDVILITRAALGTFTP